MCLDNDGALAHPQAVRQPRSVHADDDVRARDFLDPLARSAGARPVAARFPARDARGGKRGAQGRVVGEAATRNLSVVSHDVHGRAHAAGPPSIGRDERGGCGADLRARRLVDDLKNARARDETEGARALSEATRGARELGDGKEGEKGGSARARRQGGGGVGRSTASRARPKDGLERPHGPCAAPRATQTRRPRPGGEIDAHSREGGGVTRRLAERRAAALANPCRVKTTVALAAFALVLAVAAIAREDERAHAQCAAAAAPAPKLDAQNLHSRLVARRPPPQARNAPRVVRRTSRYDDLGEHLAKHRHPFYCETLRVGRLVGKLPRK